MNEFAKDRDEWQDCQKNKDTQQGQANVGHFRNLIIIRAVVQPLS